MPLSITKHSDTFSSSAQITPEDIAEIAALGFKTLINNRPDFEGGPDQPSSAAIKAAAEKAGLSYHYLPVIPGNITEANVSECKALIKNAAAPVLGFCRTGNRSTNLYNQSSNRNE